MENLFSYGTLRQEKVQLELFGRRLNGAADILKGYALSPIVVTDESFLANGAARFQQTAVASPDGSIEGAVFEISETELRLADRYEPENYRRAKVALESGKEAWIYLAV